MAHLAAQAWGHFWDLAGALVVIQEAGGRLLRLDGRPLTPFREAELTGDRLSFLAGSPRAVSRALDLLDPGVGKRE